MNDPYFYSYLAGLIDGEGCFLVFKRTTKGCIRGYTWQITLTIAQNNIEFLENLISDLGYGKITLSRSHFISLYPNNLRDLIPKILPYLRGKKTQAELTLEALKIVKFTKRNQMDMKNEKLEQIELKLKALKGTLNVKSPFSQIV